MEAVFDRVSARRGSTRSPASSSCTFNTLYQLFAACRVHAAAASTPRTRSVTDSGSAELLADRPPAVPNTRTRRRRSSSTRRSDVGDEDDRGSSALPARLLHDDRRAGHRGRRAQARRLVRARRHAGDRAGVPRHGVGGARRWTRTARPRSSAPAPGRCSAPELPAPIITTTRPRSELHERRRRRRNDRAS